ncbi:MspA family porin [Gordonia sputi]|uniref:Porin MspA n=1 Tax=Gordonia sputi NBRC 100414 TaxID=1089453 RepID=H5U649_9ACTN|nr:MspA family porin [Gordonia sputi]NKY92935.1 MspA family porin [Gordonia sputi]GAB41207.1 hypothetical protein GOSPT_123_00120 [Gordonia sputi NBRC 100414]
MKKIITRRVAAAGAAAAAAVVGLTSLGVGAADAGPLPGGSKTITLADGSRVSIKLFDESANVQRAVTNVATSREVWASGKVAVTVGGEAQGASINVGYIVGCQVNFGASGGAGGGVTADADGPTFGDNVPQASAGFTLAPGAAAYYPIISTQSSDVSNKDDDNYTANDFTFTGNSGGVAYSQERFSVDGCAGYASAKAAVTVKVSTKSVKAVVTLYGAPFSLG